jgi:hypothetical protein
MASAFAGYSDSPSDRPKPGTAAVCHHSVPDNCRGWFLYWPRVRYTGTGCAVEGQVQSVQEHRIHNEWAERLIHQLGAARPDTNGSIETRIQRG